MKKVHFDARTKAAMKVATAVAMEVQNTIAYGNPIGSYPYGDMVYTISFVRVPILSSIDKGTFRFQGGIVVSPEMVDIGHTTKRGTRLEEWVVASCIVRYYPKMEQWIKDGSGSPRQNPNKVVRELTAEDMQQIADGPCRWGWPKVMNPEVSEEEVVPHKGEEIATVKVEDASLVLQQRSFNTFEIVEVSSEGAQVRYVGGSRDRAWQHLIDMSDRYGGQ